MKKTIKITIISLASILVLLVLGLGAVTVKYGPRRTYRALERRLSGLTQPRYESYDERADAALRYCERQGLRTDYCVFVDFSKPSAERRFMLYDLQRHQVVRGGLVAHGKGLPSTEAHAAFSNLPGSQCSSLGKYHIAEYGRSKKVGRHYRLDGQDFFRNSNARMRGILIHTSRTVNRHESSRRKRNIPLGPVSEGCFTISTTMFERLQHTLDAEDKRMLLWAFDGEIE